jgi:hypothetical protein
MATPVLLLLGLVGAGICLNKKEEKSNENFENKEDCQKDVNETLINNGDYTKGYDHALPEKIMPYYFNDLKNEYKKDVIKNPNYDQNLIRVLPDKVKDFIQNHKSMETVSGTQNAEIINASNSTEEVNKWEDMLQDKGTLKHSNMVPFFGSKLTQNVDLGDRNRKMDTFTGQMPLDKGQKEEVGRFFKVTSGFSNVYGFHEKRDMTRYNPNNIGKKNNELSFRQEYVGPGLDDGFTSTPSGGFHNSVRIVPKANDQLYVNPKVENTGRLQHAKHYTQNRTAEQIVAKNTAELLVTNEEGERNFTTTGATKKTRSNPNVVIRDTSNKNNKTMINGKAPATCVKPIAEELISKTKKSHKKNYKNTPHRNATRAEGSKMKHYHKDKLKATERTTTGVKATSTFMKGEKLKHKLANFDKARSNKKELYSTNGREKGNAHSSTNGKMRQSHGDEAKGTIRQQTEKTVSHGTAHNGSQLKHKSTLDARNMEQNHDKEIIHKNRKPTNSNVKMHSGPDGLGSVETKKEDSDRRNNRAHVPTTTNNHIHNFYAITSQSLTRKGNVLSNDRHQEHINVSVVESYKNNPLTQSLNSYHHS